MAVAVRVQADYEGDADTIFAGALRFSELEEAMRGLARYHGFPASGTATEGDSFTVDVQFFGLFWIKGHQIFVEKLDVAGRVIQSREKASGVRRWDHNLLVQSVDGVVRWTDNVVIDAGWRTPFVSRFAAFVYRRRHRHRRALKIKTSLQSI